MVKSRVNTGVSAIKGVHRRWRNQGWTPVLVKPNCAASVGEIKGRLSLVVVLKHLVVQCQNCAVRAPPPKPPHSFAPRGGQRTPDLPPPPVSTGRRLTRNPQAYEPLKQTRFKENKKLKQNLGSVIGSAIGSAFAPHVPDLTKCLPQAD